MKIKKCIYNKIKISYFNHYCKENPKMRNIKCLDISNKTLEPWTKSVELWILDSLDQANLIKVHVKKGQR